MVTVPPRHEHCLRKIDVDACHNPGRTTQAAASGDIAADRRIATAGDARLQRLNAEASTRPSPSTRSSWDAPVPDQSPQMPRLLRAVTVDAASVFETGAATRPAMPADFGLATMN